MTVMPLVLTSVVFNSLQNMMAWTCWLISGTTQFNHT